MTSGSQRLAREARVAVSRPQVLDVQVLSVADRAAATGLTVEIAQRVLMLAPHWRYPVVRCPGCDLITSQILVDAGWAGRPLSYCCGCGEVRFTM